MLSASISRPPARHTTPVAPHTPGVLCVVERPVVHHESTSASIACPRWPRRAYYAAVEVNAHPKSRSVYLEAARGCALQYRRAIS